MALSGDKWVQRGACEKFLLSCIIPPPIQECTEAYHHPKVSKIVQDMKEWRMVLGGFPNKEVVVDTGVLERRD